MLAVLASFPNLEDMTLRRGLDALARGKVDRFTHEHLIETPLGPRRSRWDILAVRGVAATHFIAVPAGIGDSAAVAAALEQAIREAARNPRSARHPVVPISAGERRRIHIATIRLGRRTHLLAFPDLAAPPDTPAPELLLFVQEEERHRIAIELHDSTSQHLVAIGLGLARLRRFVKGAGAEGRELWGLTHALEAALREIRTLSYLMNPPQLERDGLQTTVQRFLAGFEARTGLKTSADVAGVPDASSGAVQHALFRVLQEALSDIYRGGSAGRVDVALAAEAGWITLTVTGDGREAAAAADVLAQAPIGVGVAGMHAPIDELGGSLQVLSDPTGKRIIARVPIGVNKRKRSTRPRRELDRG